jgi:hypothetical protein
LQHFATGQSQFEIFEEQPKVSLTGKGNGLQDRTGQEITGLLRFKSAVERPLKRCRIDALAACFRELRQNNCNVFTAPRKTGGIIHAMPHSKERNFHRL